MSSRLFLKENREAKKVSATELGQALGIERESVYRIEKKGETDSATQAKWAAALGLRPEDLWRSPDDPSLDAQIARASPEVQESVKTLLKQLIPPTE